jgi:hypothetical protein
LLIQFGGKLNITDENTFNAEVYMSLGFHLRALLYTENTECRWVIVHINETITKLDMLNFTYPRNGFDAMRKPLEEAIRIHGETTKTPASEAGKLHIIVSSIKDTVMSQAQERRLVLLQSTSVSSKLRKLAEEGTLNERQIYLFEETVVNLETGAYRSAVVMGWNLAYDIVRQWVFEDPARLASFNAELAKITVRAGRAKFDPVVNYQDFYDIGEKTVLDVCRDASLIAGNLYDDLRQHLRQRNAYAHASDSHPTVHQANGLIDHLVDAVRRL